MTPPPASQASADLKTILECVSKKLPIDPAVRERVERRADEITSRLRAEGVKELAVELIREIRDE
jgi:hypothetical protein